MKAGYTLSKLRFKKTIDLTAPVLDDNGAGEDGVIDCLAEAALHTVFLADFIKDEKSVRAWLETRPEDCEAYADVISHALSLLMKSPSAALLIRDAAVAGWSVSLQSQSSFDFMLDLDDKILTLDHAELEPCSLASSGHFLSTMMIALVKALRDVWQQKRNSGYENLFRPESVLLLERVRAADSCVLAVLIAWELRSEDCPALWRTMIGSDYGDLALTFSGMLEREPASAFTQHALALTFQQWFRDEGRVAACDHETLNMMDGLLAQARPHIFGRKTPTHICVELFSCLPDRTAYLRGDGAEILRNPYFSGLDDPVNQTHLMQIIHDAQAHYAGGVAFRSHALAALIFPEKGADALMEEVTEI
ncbi:MAG: hypothetical protein LRY54_03390 [Alphaproteobacteria bacterium]|nr:hypothetical protein [Alphaproteobacteria bacterium]